MRDMAHTPQLSCIRSNWPDAVMAFSIGHRKSVKFPVDVEPYPVNEVLPILSITLTIEKEPHNFEDLRFSVANLPHQ